MSINDNAPSPELMSDESPHHYSNKRKKIMSTNAEENSNSRCLKKLKKAHKSSCISAALSPKLKLKDGINDSDPKPVTRIKNDGRISIPCMPVKRVMVIKPERLKKKSLWSRDCDPDSWTTEEDAVLCATVNEYGPLWELASDSLHSVPGGAFYRGRYRHTVHCCERFRELFCKHILSTTDNSNSEKVPSGTGKAILKVTEDQTQMLLNVISELPNNELLLQKHFMAVLSSVWRSKCALNVSIVEPEHQKHAVEPVEKSLLSTLSYRHAESRFRIASETCFEMKALSGHHLLSTHMMLVGINPVQSPLESRKMQGQLLHSAAEFHITQSLSEFGIGDSEFTYFEDLPQEADTEFAPYQYDPNVLRCIELDPLSDFTDIG
ncbi:hypothetical protein GUJ93_ZPchr0006g44384 [Zizania palustris]|uniref:Myb-like domain-containing protein n=1 Tax=Zizania palustris TaxID=103762 RepID=A0A8J5S9R7_ZIZPA|nr:hypothetical protein GUJ93_ZPchr0006g44384 [Zizania palustris]